MGGDRHSFGIRALGACCAVAAHLGGAWNRAHALLVVMNQTSVIRAHIMV